MADKPKISFYWAASCGGCEISLVNIHEQILTVDATFDLVFCPCLLDFKKKDVEALADGEIAISFFNGAIRTADNEIMAHLLRRKSQVLIAYGACAVSGGIPALSNFSTREEHFKTIYLDSPTVDNPDGYLPQTEFEMKEGTLDLPAFYNTVRGLNQVVDVDYYFPGCPPESHQLSAVIDYIVSGKELPPKGSYLGCTDKSVCDECEREKDEQRCLTELRRPHEFIPDPKKCLLDQGLMCMGLSTRGGCGALCPQVNMPCIGCYGPAAGVLDQGAKMAGAIGGSLDVKELKELGEDQISQSIESGLKGVPDMGGTFYKFGMTASLLRRKRGK